MRKVGLTRGPREKANSWLDFLCWGLEVPAIKNRYSELKLKKGAPEGISQDKYEIGQIVFLGSSAYRKLTGKVLFIKTYEVSI